ncbi:MAG: FAD-binding protein [Rhodobacteraceae bacterium]|nr:FAD-binding protein [Paracoccaceae bacterium]
MRPETEAELSEAIAAARAPLVPRGGGTRGLGAMQGDVLETGALSGVTLYEPGALTLVVKAGTPLADVQALLAAEGQRLAFEPPDLLAVLGREGVSTIGGVVAANASGPGGGLAGACRDHVLGVRLVDGTGRVIRNGGRVMKNVTGYDLARLMAGSHGTLGVLSEVSLKVLPAPETSATLTLHGLDAARAVEAMTMALTSPFEVTGAAWLPEGMAGAGTHLRLEGFSEQVSYRVGKLAERLAPVGAAEVVDAPPRSASLWEGIRDVRALAGLPGALWRVSARGTDAPFLLERAGALSAMLDWGGGLIWLRMPEGHDLRAALGPFRGHATRLAGEAGTPAFPPEPAHVAALSAGLRARFDPRGLLNPGLMA